jgi:hypothetical protein
MRRTISWTAALLVLAAPELVAQEPTLDDAANGDYGGYFTWPEIRAKIEAWKKARPELVHETAIGRTLEGRPIVALRISDHAATDEDEPEVLLMAGIHPREQPAQVLLLRLVDEILDGYGRDARLTRLVDERELWIIPVFNVDGKVHDMKHGNGRDHGAEWRKNRRRNPDGTFGVDLNRQWPVRWGGSTDLREKPATTLSPRSDYFIGWGPMEEPESKALEAFFRERPLRVFVDIHSPFKAIYFPHHLGESEHGRYAGLARRMRELQKDPYTLSPSKRGEDPPAERGGDCGLSYDWAYSVHGVYAFIFEIFASPKWYPPMEQIDGEYANFREPMLFLIDEAARLPRPRPGTATLQEGRTDRDPAPGATVTWTPAVEGPCEVGVLVSGSADVRVTSEFRAFPLRSGFVLRVSETARAGAKVPLALYLWDRERGRSVARVEWTIAPAKKVRAGIYDFGAEGGAGVDNLKACLPPAGFEIRVLSAAAIREGTLADLEVLLVPGGSGSKQAEELQEKGRAEIKAFVERGGGYVGFCAGAYLASAQYPWSLALLDANVIDREHWARGVGPVRIRLTGEGKKLLGRAEDEVEIVYWQGPLLGPAGRAEIPDFTVLATYETEIAKNGAPTGVMKGTTAVATGTFGKGRVFCFSPHPEKTKGLESLVERAVEWAAGRRFR